MSKQFKFPGIIMGLFVTSIAAAHPGHGHGGGDFGVMHYLSDPLHMVVGLSLAVALLSAIAWSRGTLPWSRRRLNGKSG